MVLYSKECDVEDNDGKVVFNHAKRKMHIFMSLGRLAQQNIFNEMKQTDIFFLYILNTGIGT
jgi:hypothetical protein